MNQDIDKGNKKPFKAGVNEEIPPRRVVLRGALAVGCGLLLPAALFGCDSKKDENATGAATAPADSTANGTDATPDAAVPGEPGKSSQASVQYQDQPKGDQKCDGCLHFIAESNTCKVVEGQISPNGWCILWIQKA